MRNLPFTSLKEVKYIFGVCWYSVRVRKFVPKRSSGLWVFAKIWKFYSVCIAQISRISSLSPSTDLPALPLPSNQGTSDLLGSLAYLHFSRDLSPTWGWKKQLVTIAKYLRTIFRQQRTATKEHEEAIVSYVKTSKSSAKIGVYDPMKNESQSSELLATLRTSHFIFNA